jgi:ATP-dependent Clp protease ATP-binding subunit ClpC
MFERYTERARRVIFFARYEASKYGSPTIETEHMLLGLLQEDQNLPGRLLQASAEDVRRKIQEQLTALPKISTHADLPLSNECKRILAFANEEAERLNHRFIGTEHLFLGILREESSLAAEVLKDCGADLGPIREKLAKTASESGSVVVDRQSLHALLDKFPEDKLAWLKMMMEREM